MKLLIPLYSLVFLMILSHVRLDGQVIPLPLYDNPVLMPQKSEIEVRDYPTAYRVVLMPGDSQTVCISMPDLGIFDTLIDRQCTVLEGLLTRIYDNCLVVSAEQSALVSSQVICLSYIDDNGFDRSIKMTVDLVEPIKLPFFDDFSNQSNYPDQLKWIDKNVYVNNTFALNPPTIGVATFDGLNSNGTPYGGSFGRADYLTSTYLDLSDIPDEQPVFLSFFLQPKGLNYIHQQRDSIVIEYKDQSGNWNPIVSYMGMDPSKPAIHIDSFSQNILGINPDYRYNGFQFRFVNYSYRLGVYSTWHLDYVRLVANQVPGPSLNDIAFVKAPNSLLSKYSAIPFKQIRDFGSNEVSTETRIDLYNHFLNQDEDIFNTRLRVTDDSDGTVIIDRELVNTVPQLNPPKGLNHFVNAFDGSQLVDRIGSHDPEELPVFLRTTYEFDQDQEAPNGPEFNNHVSGVTEIGETLAYDDGSAEINIAAEANNSVKSQIAVKFHLNTGDTLRAVQMQFPRLYNNVSSQLFNLKVWVATLDDEPEYYYQLRRPIYPDQLFDTLQGFTTYELVSDLTGEPTPLYIPPGDFYIGWQQFSVAANGLFIPVGFDRNYQGGEELTYYKSDGDWKKLSELSSSPLLKGIPMLRALFKNAWTTSGTIDIEEAIISLYPNPTTGTVHVSLEDETPVKSYRIFDELGQMKISGPIEQTIEFVGLKPAIYHVVFYDDKNRISGIRKVILVN